MGGRAWQLLLAVTVSACASDSLSVSMPELPAIAPHWLLLRPGEAPAPHALGLEDKLEVELEEGERLYLMGFNERLVTSVSPSLDAARLDELKFVVEDTSGCPGGRFEGPGLRRWSPPFEAYELLSLGPGDERFEVADAAPSFLSGLSVVAPVDTTCGLSVTPPEVAFEPPGVQASRVAYVDEDRVLLASPTDGLFLLRRGEPSPVAHLDFGTEVAGGVGVIQDMVLARDHEPAPVALVSVLYAGLARVRVIGDALELVDVVGPASPPPRLNLIDVALSSGGEVLAAGDDGLVATATAVDAPIDYQILEEGPSVNRVAHLGSGARPHVLGLQGGAVWFADLGRPGEVDRQQPTTRAARQLVVVQGAAGRELWLVDTLGAVLVTSSSSDWGRVPVELPPEAEACSVTRPPDACGFPSFEQGLEVLEPFAEGSSQRFLLGFSRCTGAALLDATTGCVGWLGAPGGASVSSFVIDGDALGGRLLAVTDAGELYEMRVE